MDQHRVCESDAPTDVPCGEDTIDGDAHSDRKKSSQLPSISELNDLIASMSEVSGQVASTDGQTTSDVSRCVPSERHAVSESARQASSSSSTVPRSVDGDTSYRSHNDEVLSNGTNVSPDGEQCCVCLDARADPKSILPCGHECVCAFCAHKLAMTLHRNMCPYCRAPFQLGNGGFVRAREIIPAYDGILYRRLRAVFLEQRDQCQGEPVKCPCGEVMVKVEARDAYFVTNGCPVECDVCNRMIRGRSTVYHCPHELHSHHPFGFDLCKTCCHGGTHFAASNCILTTVDAIRSWLTHLRRRLIRA